MSDSIRLATGNVQGQVTAPALKPAHQSTIQLADPVKEQKAAPKIDPQKMADQLKEIVEKMNKQMKDSNRDLGFAIDDRINTFIVTVRNTNTGEVIRQIPNEVVVNMAHSIEDLKGVLFNETL